ncbi:LytR C-terminal domain-containing protein [Peterkaempfera griseoplana]|uniref:LytR C-terminal domain-containing protein n=1 Tax=Peterkaempfera griseoplana TaxID=66896 RepID=UPI002AFDF591|nr:LytR C-terminal domain-containing protein [Peterkaempfera griseoplana]
MLTPPGLKGKQYRVTGNSYPRLVPPNKRRRRIVALVSTVLVVAVISWGAVQLTDIFGSASRKLSAGSCPAASPSASKASAHGAGDAAASPAPTGVPKPQAVTVNVYNATTRPGLAGRTADELRKRGFKVGKVGNAPANLDKKVKESVRLIGGPSGSKALLLLGTHVKGAKTTPDTRKDASVDFVIGNGFTALLSPAQAEKALAAATKPSPKPSGAHC